MSESNNSVPIHPHLKDLRRRPVSEGPLQESVWRRILNWLTAFGEAMETSYDDFQDLRIIVLEREVARLSTQPNEATVKGSTLPSRSTV